MSVVWFTIYLQWSTDLAENKALGNHVMGAGPMQMETDLLESFKAKGLAILPSLTPSPLCTQLYLPITFKSRQSLLLSPSQDGQGKPNGLLSEFANA